MKSFPADSLSFQSRGHVVFFFFGGGTVCARTTLWLRWEMLHVGNYSWRASSKGPGTANISDGMGRSRRVLSALLGHSCGEWNPLQPLISARSPLAKNNNKLRAFCLYGTWPRGVLISGFGDGCRSDVCAFPNTAAVASGDGF